MPRYYCDYCDTYLTHDSPSVRTQHNAGYKHKANVRAYYQQFEEQQTQSLIDQKVKEHLGQTAAGGGAAFQQHLAALQSGHYKPPLLGAAPGTNPSSQPPLLPSIRLPVLPPPTMPTSGYGSPGVQYQYRPPGPLATQPNGVQAPPTMTPPGAPARSSAAPPGAPAGNSNGSYISPPGYNSYNYGPSPPGAAPRPVAPAPATAAGTTGSAGPAGPAVSTAPTYTGVQQPPRSTIPSGAPGSQVTYAYNQSPGAQITPNSSYVPPPPGAPVGYRS